jgi:hypothetical protein
VVVDTIDLEGTMSRIRQNPRIFASTNLFFQLAGEHGVLNLRGVSVADIHEGICFGITSYWCKAILSGIRDLLTQPDYRLGETLQSCYNISSGPTLDQRKQKIWDLAGLDGTKVLADKSTRVMLGVIALQKGTYLASNGAHVIGFHTVGSQYYFYDCDENGGGGLYLYEDKQGWEQKVLTHYQADEPWNCWKVSLKG